ERGAGFTASGGAARAGSARTVAAGWLDTSGAVRGVGWAATSTRGAGPEVIAEPLRRNHDLGVRSAGMRQRRSQRTHDTQEYPTFAHHLISSVLHPNRMFTSPPGSAWTSSQ